MWEWADADGEPHKQPMREAIADIKAKEPVWAWVEDKHVLHIWIGDTATPAQVLGVLAHEVGHTYRPYHRCVFKEEQKAAKRADIAMLAFDIMNALI